MINVHFPNRRLEPEELDEILSLGCKHYLIYLPDWDLNEQGFEYWTDVCREVKRRIPDSIIHLRFEKRGELDNPLTEARELAACSLPFAGVADTVRWRNEPNIETPGLDPVVYLRWLTYFLAYSESYLEGSLLLFAPAISPDGPNWRELLRATYVAVRAVRGVGIDVHAYGWSWRIRQILEEVRQEVTDPSVRLLVSEFNFGAGNEVDLGVYVHELPRIVSLFTEFNIWAGIWFIWEWENPDSRLRTPVNLRGSVIAEAIKEGIKVPVFEFRLGFRNFASALRERGIDPGVPLENNAYSIDPQGERVFDSQKTTTGELIWVKRLNDMFFVGNDRRVVAYNGGNLESTRPFPTVSA